MPTLLTVLLLSCSSPNVPVDPSPSFQPLAPNESLSRQAELARFEEGCDDGASDACSALGLYYSEDEDARNLERSTEYMTRACDLKMSAACASAGARLMERSPPNTEKAQAMFDKGCALDDPTSCFGLGQALSLTDEVERMEGAYGKACEGDQKQACANLAVHLHAEGPRNHPKRAHAAADRACALNIGVGCAIQATYYRGGEHFPADEERARSLLRQACTLGHQDSCSADELQ